MKLLRYASHRIGTVLVLFMFCLRGFVNMLLEQCLALQLPTTNMEVFANV